MPPPWRTKKVFRLFIGFQVYGRHTRGLYSPRMHMVCQTVLEAMHSISINHPGRHTLASRMIRGTEG